MDVHAAAVVADDGFRHEGQRLAIAMSDVLQRVFQNLHFVGFLGQRICSDVDLALARRGHLMMMHLEFEAHLLASQ